MNILERKKEIKRLMASGNLTEAVKRSMDYVEDFGRSNELTNEIVRISSRFFELKRLKDQDDMDSEAFSQQKNQTLRRMLELLDEVEALFAQHLA